VSASFSALFGTSRESANLHGIAVAAVRAGYAILPIAPGGKAPVCTLPPLRRRQADRAVQEEAKAAGKKNWHAVRHGCGVRHAITDEKEATRVFKRLVDEAPDLNLALEVGHSRMICVDADTAAEVEGFTAWWAEQTGIDLLRWVQPTVSSPGKVNADGEWVHKGGGHFWFSLPEGMDFLDAPTADGVKLPGGAVAYFKDRAVLVPPSVRDEGAYVLRSDVGQAPEFLINAVRSKLGAFAERRALQTERLLHEDDPIDHWSVATPWAELLEPDGWTRNGKFTGCGCEEWSRPGDWSNDKSATAHEPGCADFECEQGGFLHLWTDNPPEELLDAGKNLSKLQYVTAMSYDGDVRTAMKALNLGAIRDAGIGELFPETTPEVVRDPFDFPGDESGEAAWEDLPGLLVRSELDTLPPPVWLVRGWLTKESLARVSGAPGSWKSFLALDMAACIATGREYHGCQVTRGRVLYVAGEGVAGLRKRVVAWERASGVSVPDDSFALLPYAIPANNPDAWSRLEAHVRREKYDLVILDTQARVTPGMDENSVDAMGEFVAGLEKLKRASKACILTVHHSGHGQKRGRGSSSVWGAMDIELFLDRDKDKGTASLEFLKSKDSEEDERLVFKAKKWELWTDEEGEIVTSLTLYPIDADELDEAVTEKGVSWYADFLDGMNVPATAGRVVCRNALKEHGLSVGNDMLAQIVKERKDRS